MIKRELHKDFEFCLRPYDSKLVGEFKTLRSFVFKIYPDSNELLYHTHALTAVFSTSLKLSDAFCMIPIYTNHFNLGFNKGTLLKDTEGILQGTGKLIRHVPIVKTSDYNNKEVIRFLKEAIQLSIDDMKPGDLVKRKTISKIKPNS